MADGATQPLLGGKNDFTGDLVVGEKQNPTGGSNLGAQQQQQRQSRNPDATKAHPCYGSAVAATTTTSTAAQHVSKVADHPPADGESSDDSNSRREDCVDDPNMRGGEHHPAVMPLINIVCILSTAFSYGCILTTLFMIILPIECERIHQSHSSIAQSVLLGCFVALAGLTQLVSPLVGRASDTFEPPRIKIVSSSTTTLDAAIERADEKEPTFAAMGQRLPYYMFGAFLAGVGLLCQMVTSYTALWIRYCFSFVFSMVGLNIQYAMMLALIPDQIPRLQTGVANGILALLLVAGSITGFALFHLFFTHDDIGSMYGLYTSIVILSSITTGSYANEQDVSLSVKSRQRKSLRLSSWLKSDPSKTAIQQSVTVKPSPRTWPVKARRATKRAMKRAVQKAQQIVITPTIIGHSLLEPFRKFTPSVILSCYTIDTTKHHDFFIVTLSRLFYYCGMSVQTFFLYFLHDIIHVRRNPEAAVAILAIVGQCSAALTCYPVGTISDHWLNGRRTPFVYASCVILAITTMLIIFATTFEHMLVLCLVLGAANGAYLTAETSLAVDSLSDESDPEDDCGSAQLLGVWGVAAFLGSALGPLIGGPLLCTFGALPVQPLNNSTKMTSVALVERSGDDIDSDDYSLTGYAVVVSLSAFYFLCSAITLRFLNSKDTP